jgi:hypothetical protein
LGSRRIGLTISSRHPASSSANLDSVYLYLLTALKIQAIVWGWVHDKKVRSLVNVRKVRVPSEIPGQVPFGAACRKEPFDTPPSFPIIPSSGLLPRSSRVAAFFPDDPE